MTRDELLREERDATLVERAQRGDKRALETLIERYQEPLLTYISKITPNLEDAKDIRQETFQKLYSNLESYSSQYAFSTWLYTIAKNSAYDHHRKMKRRPLSAPLKGESEEPLYEGSIPGPEKTMISKQSVEKITTTIRELPPLYREVAELRFIQGYPLEEIANKLNLPLNTVKTRVRRAKENLEQLWRE